MLIDGWRASFRLRVPGEVFTPQGDTEIFATELQATKWLHAEASKRGCSAIEIRNARSHAPARQSSLMRALKSAGVKCRDSIPSED
jgi:hypothetical protein